MITLDSILENIIAEVVLIIVSAIFSVLLPKLIRKNKDEKAGVKYDPLSIVIFIEAFLI